MIYNRIKKRVMAKKKKKIMRMRIIRDIEQLDPRFKQIVYDLVKDLEYHRIPIKPFETKRTLERQKKLYKDGASKTLKSKHLEGLACDFVVVDNKDKWSWDYKLYAHYYDMFGAIAVKKYGLVWGGNWENFRDYPHVHFIVEE